MAIRSNGVQLISWPTLNIMWVGWPLPNETNVICKSNPIGTCSTEGLVSPKIDVALGKMRNERLWFWIINDLDVNPGWQSGISSLKGRFSTFHESSSGGTNFMSITRLQDNPLCSWISPPRTVLFKKIKSYSLITDPEAQTGSLLIAISRAVIVLTACCTISKHSNGNQDVKRVCIQRDYVTKWSQIMTDLHDIQTLNNPQLTSQAIPNERGRAVFTFKGLGCYEYKYRGR